MNKILTGLIVWFFLNCFSVAAQTPSLRGSRTSVNRMYRQALAHDFTKIRNDTQLDRFVKNKLLVPLRDNKNYEIDSEVSHNYVRPAVRLFIERFSAQYRAVCGEKLVVTSLIRPANEQPSNASEKSVHPMGMAVDFRIPAKFKCRRWLENTLLSLEKNRVLEATRERRPPHYHVAVFPKPYEKYVTRRLRKSYGEARKEKK